jgi:hypothetical protein
MLLLMMTMLLLCHCCALPRDTSRIKRLLAAMTEHRQVAEADSRRRPNAVVFSITGRLVVAHKIAAFAALSLRFVPSNVALYCRWVGNRPKTRQTKIDAVWREKDRT